MAKQSPRVRHAQGLAGRLWAGKDNEMRRRGIDYSPTEQSQNTSSIENSTWHSMKADGEEVTDQFAKARGQEFGWNKIFEASKEIDKAGGIEKLKKIPKVFRLWAKGFMLYKMLLHMPELIWHIIVLGKISILEKKLGKKQLMLLKELY